jgi:hypothetical protein
MDMQTPWRFLTSVLPFFESFSVSCRSRVDLEDRRDTSGGKGHVTLLVG